MSVPLSNLSSDPVGSGRRSSLATRVVDHDQRVHLLCCVLSRHCADDHPFQPLPLYCSRYVFRPGTVRDGYVDFTDFQLKYAPRAWKQERLVWTTVVQLNLIKNVNNILDALNHEMAIQTATRADPAGDTVPAMADQFTEKHKILRLRLAPLRGVQTDLERKLGSGALEDQGQFNNNGRVHAQSTSAVTRTIAPTESSPINGGGLEDRRLPKEFYIRSNNSWKDRFKSGLKNAGRPHSGGSIHNVFRARAGKEKEVSLAEWGKVNADLGEITSIIAGCREDIKALWEDELVQRIMTKRKYRVDESSGLCVLYYLGLTAED